MLEQVWVEKYRPKRLDDIVGQSDIIKSLKSYVKSRNMPHLLFSGHPGTGKTASAISLARELFGDEWSENFMELNTSDERGIDVVRGKIKDFARSSTVGEAEWRIVLLDEADALTSDAQSALRRIMEKYTKVCRFILSCNYSSKIIEPIQSRCAIYKFKRISDEAIIERINYISNIENLEISPTAIQAIKYVAQGDLRRAINVLQAAATIDRKIDANIIYKTSAMATPKDISDLIMTSLEGNFAKAHTKMNYLLDDQGLAGTDITGQIYREIFNINIPDKLKVELIDYLGDIDFRISEGGNERLQLGALISKFILYGINRQI